MCLLCGVTIIFVIYLVGSLVYAGSIMLLWELGSDLVGLFAQILLTPTTHLW